MDTAVFHLQPWAPQVKVVADKLIHDIHGVAPELEVLFMGAAALGLPGKNDIDLDILCSKDDLDTYTEKLTPLLGAPAKVSDATTAWKFMLSGYEIDCILSDPVTSHVPLQRKRFEILKSSPDLQHNYRRLKEKCDGLPYAEYERRKIDFFEEKVLSSSDWSSSDNNRRTKAPHLKAST